MATDHKGREYGSFYIEVGGAGSGSLGWSTKDSESFSSVSQAKNYGEDNYGNKSFRIMEVETRRADTIAYNTKP